MGQKWVFSGQSTPLEVKKIFFPYPPRDLRSIQLYSKFQIFPTYGSLGAQKYTNFPQIGLWATSGRQPASKSKIPPLTRFARPLGEGGAFRS